MATTLDTSTTWGGFWAKVRDNLSGVTGYSIDEDTTNGGTSFADGDRLAVGLPSGEVILWRFGQGYDGGGVQTEMGPSYNNDGTWSDRYRNDPHSRMGDTGTSFRPETGDACQYGDQVVYSMYYGTDGFVAYCYRNEGDGNDGDYVVGASDVVKLWDYSTADVREADWFPMEGGDERYGANAVTRYNMEPVGNGHPSIVARGGRNPDANFDNFPMERENQLRSGQYGDCHIGTHNVWGKDLSGNDTAHGDTVQDSNGNDVYYILKQGGVIDDTLMAL